MTCRVQSDCTPDSSASSLLSIRFDRSQFRMSRHARCASGSLRQAGLEPCVFSGLNRCPWHRFSSCRGEDRKSVCRGGRSPMLLGTNWAFLLTYLLHIIHIIFIFQFDPADKGRRGLSACSLYQPVPAFSTECEFTPTYGPRWLLIVLASVYIKDLRLLKEAVIVLWKTKFHGIFYFLIPHTITVSWHSWLSELQLIGQETRW